MDEADAKAAYEQGRQDALRDVCRWLRKRYDARLDEWHNVKSDDPWSTPEYAASEAAYDYCVRFRGAFAFDELVDGKFP